MTVTDTLRDQVVVYRNPPGEVCGRGDTMAFAEPAGGSAASVLPVPAGRPPPQPKKRASTCAPGALCLLDGRFEVTAVWTKADGETGPATPFPGGGTTGYMSFFSPGNIELAVKVLDGRTHNDAFWLFAAGLTDVDYELTVTDKGRPLLAHLHEPEPRLLRPRRHVPRFPQSGTARATGPQ